MLPLLPWHDSAQLCGRDRAEVQQGLGKGTQHIAALILWPCISPRVLLFPEYPSQEVSVLAWGHRVFFGEAATFTLLLFSVQAGAAGG